MEKRGEDDVNVTYKPDEFIPVQEYFKMQGRYRSLSDEKLSLIQERINKRLEKYKLI